MKKLILWACVLTACLQLQAQSKLPLQIIPQPQEVVVGQGTFVFDPLHTRVAAKGKEATGVMKAFTDKLARSTGYRLKKGKAYDKATVSFVIDESLQGRPEAYKLTVTAERVVARAATSAGLFYAMQSLLQLLPPEVESDLGLSFGQHEIPALTINDSPRFAYRGVMLDPCRHFLPVGAVKRQIDLLASYKINKMHWHLTDDQGWRVEIKKYPLLTQVGARRTEGDGSIHEGYYTQEDIREVVEYARKRHVEVIPELEIPGHELAAIAAYPGLSCKGLPQTPRIIWGVEDVVMCPGKENMFHFLQDVIDELVQLFPSRYFHIGGDESSRSEWKDCERCQQRMRELGYKNEAQLQSYVVSRIEDYLQTKGKTIIGWDEILEGGNLRPSAVVMSWRGEEGGITAAKAGHPVLMTPSGKGFYFDQFQGDPVTEPSCAIGGYSTLQKVYAYNPVPQEVHELGRDSLVLGIQANCWSEYLPSVSLLEYRLYPRALALAEVGWTQPANKDYTDFVRRVDGDASLRLKYRHVNYHIPMPEQPGGSLNRMVFAETDTLHLKNTRNLPMVYTLDGTNPTASSLRYTSPITVTRTTEVRAACLLPSGILSPVRTMYMEKTLPAKAVAVENPRQGLKLSKWDGNFLRPEQVTSEPVLKDSIVAGFEQLRTQTYVPANVRNVKHYAATVEGYIRIPRTGIYEFSTDNSQLYVDGNLVIDHSQVKVLRYSTQNVELYLEAGFHPVKALFLGGIFGGWPTYWDSARVRIRPQGGKWQAVSPSWLFH